MCSFGSCQTRFEFLSQFRKVRNAFECFVTQVQTHLPKTKRVWPMKINVICTVHVLCTYSSLMVLKNQLTSIMKLIDTQYIHVHLDHGAIPIPLSNKLHIYMHRFYYTNKHVLSIYIL